MKKIIRLQDAKFKLNPSGSNEASIFIDKNIKDYLNLKVDEEFKFKIDKDNILKALSFTYSFNKNIYSKKNKAFLDSAWFKDEYEKIILHFQASSEYKVNVTKQTGDRIYLNSLGQESGFNIRNILIEGHFKIDFNGSELRLQYSNEPYALDDEKSVSGNDYDGSSIILFDKDLRSLIFKSFKYVRNEIDERDLLLGYKVTEGRRIEDRIYKGLTLPKYFNNEVLIGLFSSEQLDENLKSGNTSRFISEKIRVLDYENSYFTSQWNDVSDKPLSLNNFNLLLKDVSKNTLEIVNSTEGYQLILKKISNSKSKNIIYYGAPGTGKSHVVNDLTKAYDQKGRVERVTFHPEYDYASFVGSYKPAMFGNNIRYEFVPQAFTNIYINAWKDLENNYYLIIEEINRGNCAEIFGDIFQILDRSNDYKITPSKELKEYLELQLGEDSNIDSSKLLLPPNLNILATMNTSDQSLFPMDSAFKRRWDWEYVPINYKLSKSNNSAKFKVEISELESFSWLKFIKSVNSFIKTNENLGADKCLGNYFINPDLNVISLSEFINKAIFYLWNDVFKDEMEDQNIFVNKTTYEDFFPIEENGANKVREILDFLEVSYKSSDE